MEAAAALCLRLFTHPPEEGARKGGTYIDSIYSHQAFASSSPRGLAVDDIPHCLVVVRWAFFQHDDNDDRNGGFIYN